MFEMRRIIFTEEEIVDALKTIMMKRGDHIPDRVKPVVILGRDMQSRPNALLVYTHVQPSTEHSFGNQEILAALVMHCMAKRVPLPKDAEKTLEIVDGHMALNLRYGALIDSEESDLSRAG